MPATPQKEAAKLEKIRQKEAGSRCLTFFKRKI